MTPATKNIDTMSNPAMHLFKIVSFKRTFLILGLLAFFAAAKANNDGGIQDNHKTLPFKGTAAVIGISNPIQVGQSATIDYTAYTEPSTQQTKTIKNIITFSIDEEQGLVSNLITQDFTATIKVNIDYGNSSGSYNTVTGQVFTVTYKRGSGDKYQAKQYFTLNEAKWVRVTITDISGIPVISGFDTRNVVVLDNEMDITRYVELPSSVPSPTGYSYTSPTDPVPDHLTVNWNWPANTGNNATQLEWAWVETEMESYYYVGGVLNTDLVFKNSTRVDLPYNKINYDIPLLYDGVGKLYYRIRAVNVKASGNRSDGPWNVGTAYAFTGHNNGLNWQATTSFAEEGKRKSVIQYFDGSLRGRQTVTKDNSTDTIVTAESFYDAQGRAAIQILPTPGISRIIQYQANLNLFNGQSANQDPAEIFDMQPVATPNSLTPPLLTTSGTSQYYSASNPTAGAGANKSIPDADGYPYTVTRYTPDATGRVMTQSGLGLAHKMGSGHETKYYYGGASQEELDGLFGTEVGNFTHYSKNMVKDANGQMSVSYVDMHGRTIATALAGAAPANLQALDINHTEDYPNQAGTNITRNLLDNSSNIVKGNNIESINSLLVPALTSYSFRYELNPQVLEMAACAGATPATLCYDCLYDLEIAITDESGETDPVVKKFTNVSLNPDDNCSTATPAFKDVATSNVSNIITFTQSLQPGSYSIRKTLSISESSFQYYKDLYLSKAVCKTQQQLIDSVYSVLLSTSNCGNTTPATCQSCISNLGSFSTFRTNYLLSIGVTSPSQQIENDIIKAYDQAQENCNLLCGNTSQSLPTIRQMMLADMIPYTGQYAQQDATNNTVGGVHTMFDKYNIFSTATPATQPVYRHPWDNNKLPDYYRDDAGNMDLTIHPDPVPSSYTFLNNTTPGDFEQLFKDSWAKALLPHHPEYDRLVFAEGLGTSYNFINNFTQADYTAATTGGYFSPVAIDPFFAIAPSSYTTNINAQISNYQGMGVGMWQLAYGDVNCKSIADITIRHGCYTAAPNTAPPYVGFTPAQNAQVWQVFKGLYAAVRNGYVDNYIATTKPLPSTDENDLVTQKFRLWFPRSNQQTAIQDGWDWWPTTVGGPPTGTGTGGGTGTPAATYSSQCSSYINRWKTQLLQCAALAARPDAAAIITEITNRMQVVCLNGSNPANPYGSSNVDPAAPATVIDRSFEDVIKNVFISNGILSSTGVYEDNYCNPFVIDWPKPYGKGPQMTGGGMTGQVDSCNCKAFAKVAAEATANGYNPALLSSLNVYLQAKYGEILTQGMFDGLQHCSEIIHDSCFTSDTLIKYDCAGAVPNCPVSFTCISIDSLVNQFNASGTVYLDPIDCNNAFVVLFNGHYGTSYTISQIDSIYLANCGHLIGICDIPATFNCGEMSKFVANFVPTVPGGCRDEFTTNFNSNFGTSYTWNQLVDIYSQNCGITLDVCGSSTTGYDCYELSTLVKQFQSSGVLYPDCHKEFTEFFSVHYGTPYTWAQIVAIYLNTCGTSLNVCGDGIPVYNCTDLEFFLQNYQPPSVDSCHEYLVYHFNDYFHTSYTWQQIVQIYLDNCGIIINICGDSYVFTCRELDAVIQLYQASPTSEPNCKYAFTLFFNNYYGTSYTWAEIAAIYLHTCGTVLDVCTVYCYLPCTTTTCVTIYTGPYTLPQPQPLPEFLKCGYTSNPHCISCAKISTLTGEYKAAFTAPVNTAPIFAGTNLTADQVSYNMNFARFLNYRTGFQYSWMDYAQAAANAAPAACDLDNYAGNSGATQNVICGSAHPLADTISIPKDSACAKVYTMAVTLAQNIYEIRQQYLLQQFDAAYKTKCLAAKDIEQFTVNYTNSEYHYTLYYYDMAGSLVKTIPPKGVHPDFSTTFTNSTKVSRNTGDYILNPIRPSHTFATNYRYNSLGQVMAQNTPDANTSNFWYDRLGRLAVSQNAKQFAINKFSYTLYDPFGRITEVGQKPQAANSMTQTVSQDDIALNTWINTGGGTKEQITSTSYDLAYPPLAGSPTYITQNNLRNRVSYTMTRNLATDVDQAAATFYSYDVHGNVDILLQDYKEATSGMAGSNSRYKLITYEYDLISGKVNQVNYQPGYVDAFYHRYNYDAENRLTSVETSRDKILWERDAAYSYYKHGPMSRTELGQLRVQGTDYAYTLQGWIKGVNQTSLDPANDIGQDGTTGSTVARDILSYGLHYYDETVSGQPLIDYKPISGASAFARPGTAAGLLSLYNGNIAAMSVNNAGMQKITTGTNNKLPLLYRYQYDQLNRIVSMQAYKGLNTSANAWTAVAIDDYKENSSYDPNGNIITYSRNGDAARIAMDDMHYSYKANTNQLDRVNDLAADASSGDYPKYNDVKQNQTANNYHYDAIGNLIFDGSENNINDVNWSVYGKILSIAKNTGTVSYTYDAAGNRISKTIAGRTTLYVRDASGNTMSIYESVSGAEPVQKENHLYGSRRLGMQTELTSPSIDITLAGGFGTAKMSIFTRGEKLFELTNHLGNVLVTVSDRKLQHTTDNSTVDYFEADIITVSDYYPGGMQMPGRKYSNGSSSYRYSINGQEKETELNENITSALFWEYDSRIIRRWNIDPILKDWESPYMCFSGNPIALNDPLGNTSGGDKKRKEHKDNTPQPVDLWITGNYQGGINVVNTMLSDEQAKYSTAIMHHVKNSADLLKVIESYRNKGIEIRNIYFNGHGSYDNANFTVGDTKMNLADVQTDKNLAKIGTLLATQTKVVPTVIALMCHGGAQHNGGHELMLATSKAFQANVVAAASWVSDIGVYTNTGLIEIDGSFNWNKYSGKGTAFYGLLNAGKWNKVYKGEETVNYVGSIGLHLDGSFNFYTNSYNVWLNRDYKDLFDKYNKEHPEAPHVKYIPEFEIPNILPGVIGGNSGHH